MGGGKSERERGRDWHGSTQYTVAELTPPTDAVAGDLGGGALAALTTDCTSASEPPREPVDSPVRTHSWTLAGHWYDPL